MHLLQLHFSFSVSPHPQVIFYSVPQNADLDSKFPFNSEFGLSKNVPFHDPPPSLSLISPHLTYLQIFQSHPNTTLGTYFQRLKHIPKSCNPYLLISIFFCFGLTTFPLLPITFPLFPFLPKCRALNSEILPPTLERNLIWTKRLITHTDIISLKYTLLLTHFSTETYTINLYHLT